MKVFLDTNIFFRYLVSDNQEMHKDCVSLINHILEGKIAPYTSNIVLVELIYTMTTFYKYKKEIILNDIEKLLKLRNLTIIETTDSRWALKLFKQYNIKYGDCLIATQVPEKGILASYDMDFAKISYLKLHTPGEIIRLNKS